MRLASSNVFTMSEEERGQRRIVRESHASAVISSVRRWRLVGSFTMSIQFFTVPYSPLIIALVNSSTLRITATVFGV